VVTDGRIPSTAGPPRHFGGALLRAAWVWGGSLLRSGARLRQCCRSWRNGPGGERGRLAPPLGRNLRWVVRVPCFEGIGSSRGSDFAHDGGLPDFRSEQPQQVVAGGVNPGGHGAEGGGAGERAVPWMLWPMRLWPMRLWPMRLWIRVR
jgi:hypothetical protein